MQHIEGQTMLCLAMLYLVKFHHLIFQCTCILNVTCWAVEHSIVSISDKSNTFEMEVLGYLQQLGDEQQTTKMDGLPQSCTIGCQRSDDYYSFGGDGISVPYKCVPRLHCLVTNVAH